MNSRERVKACLNFKKPDRVPRDLWALPYVISFQKEEYSEVIKEYPLDFKTSQLSPGLSDVTVKMLEKKGNYTDDWGSLWYIGEPGVIGEVKKPAIDDWPKLRKFKPLYKEYCDMIHNADKFAFFHTDGDTEEIFGDFVDVGIDAINSQLFTMNIEEIGKKYKWRITFWGEIDRQYILPFGTLEEVENAVKRVKSALYSGKGGIIAQCERGKNNSMQNIKTVFKVWNNQI